MFHRDRKVEVQAVHLSIMRQVAPIIELTALERRALRADFTYCLNFRCVCHRGAKGGTCICLDTMDRERLGFISEQSGVSRERVYDVFAVISVKSKLREWENLPPYAPEIMRELEAKKNGKRYLRTSPDVKRKRGGQSYGDALRQSALALSAQGLSCRKIANQLNISDTTVSKWLKDVS